MTIREMTTNDIYSLKLEEEWMYDRYYYYLESDIGKAWVMEDEGGILCMFGVIFEWNSTSACEVWFNLIRKKKVFNMLRTTKRLILEKAEELGIKRMQAIVKCSSEMNIKFLRFMGFVNETPYGMKNKLYNGETAFLYARYF